MPVSGPSPGRWWSPGHRACASFAQHCWSLGCWLSSGLCASRGFRAVAGFLCIQAAWSISCIHLRRLSTAGLFHSSSFLTGRIWREHLSLVFGASITVTHAGWPSRFLRPVSAGVRAANVVARCGSYVASRRGLAEQSKGAGKRPRVLCCGKLRNCHNRHGRPGHYNTLNSIARIMEVVAECLDEVWPVPGKRAKS